MSLYYVAVAIYTASIHLWSSVPKYLGFFNSLANKHTVGELARLRSRLPVCFLDPSLLIDTSLHALNYLSAVANHRIITIHMYVY